MQSMEMEILSTIIMILILMYFSGGPARLITGG